MSLEELLQTRVPMNRQERFFTHTVFPMLVANDDFTRLGRFLALAGLDAIDVGGQDPSSTRVQVFTEYALLESLVGPWVDEVEPSADGRDAPDVLVHVEGSDGAPSVLLGVEACMFAVPCREDLHARLERKAALLQLLRPRLAPDVAIHQVVVLPQKTWDLLGDVDAPVVTWEQLHTECRDSAPAYWLKVLAEALRHYDALVARPPESPCTADAHVRGADLVAAHDAGDPTYAWMGRDGGVDGVAVSQDIASGAWRDRRYRVRCRAVDDDPSWFPVAAFTARLHGAFPR